MTIAELKKNIKDGYIRDAEMQYDDFARGYNMAIRHSLLMIDLYERYQEKEVEKIYVKDLGEYK